MASNYETPSTNVLEISTCCKEHNKPFEIYCKKHDCCCCSKCVVSNHQTCQDLIMLEDMVKNVKKSYGFHDIQQTISDLVDTIQGIKKKRKENLSKLKEERLLIEKEIEQTRIKINDQLDKLKEGIMKELYEAETKESKMIGQLLDSIEKKEKEIIWYQENLVNIKQQAPDLQAFLVMKEMERQMAEEEEYFTSLVKSNKLNRVSLSCKINDALQHICKEIKSFGEVIVSTCSCELDIVRKKQNQAQIVVAPAQYKSIDNISVILQVRMDTKLDNIKGCALLPDSRIVFSCLETKRVRGFNGDGSQSFDISLQSSSAIDITYIHDNNTIAVTGGDKKCISIIDVWSRTIKETVPVGASIYGIISRNNTLIYCARDRGIHMINMSDKSVSNIVTRKMSWCAYITILADKLYYTNKDTHTVTCSDLHGKIKWEFKDESVLRKPQGISVDNAGNVYVVGFFYDNVVVISPDGQRHRRLLSSKDGLSSPQVLHYDRTTNQLLVANQKGKAFLYKVE